MRPPSRSPVVGEPAGLRRAGSGRALPSVSLGADDSSTVSWSSAAPRGWQPTCQPPTTWSRDLDCLSSGSSTRANQPTSSSTARRSSRQRFLRRARAHAIAAPTSAARMSAARTHHTHAGVSSPASAASAVGRRMSPTPRTPSVKARRLGLLGGARSQGASVVAGGAVVSVSVRSVLGRFGGPLGSRVSGVGVPRAIRHRGRGLRRSLASVRVGDGRSIDRDGVGRGVSALPPPPPPQPVSSDGGEHAACDGSSLTVAHVLP